MDAPALTCQDERRRRKAREKGFNGLDYLEVSDDQLTLTVYFLGKAPEEIEKGNVRITGGRRVRDIQVIDLRLCIQDDPERDDCMIVTVDKPGDFSTYKLCLVGLGEDVRIDPRYACLEFSFKVSCPSGLDCKPQIICPPEARDEPEINYLAKDYASFRQLMLDRLALIMPDWQERHVPDLNIALVELLAYVGDHLSYYQDAVATEAYLDTARQRVSARRHARLVDYPMHEGCNARAWIWVELKRKDKQRLDPKDIYFLTRPDNAPVTGQPLNPNDLPAHPTGRYEVFEPLVEDVDEDIVLYRAHNEIHFYTWCDRECCLPRGATSATLKDEWVPVEEAKPEEEYEQTAQQKKPPKAEPAPEPPERERKLHLEKDDILIFEEVIGPKTGNKADADPVRRHAVRLTRVKYGEDPLYKQSEDSPYNQPIVEIEWAEEDALPFPLCISTIGPAPECELLEDISIARGNVVLVDHGRRIEDEDLGRVRAQTTMQVCEGESRPSDVTTVPVRFRPVLERAPLTFSQPLPEGSPASRLLTQDPRRALPQVELTGTRAAPGGDVVTQWVAQRDLLASQGDAPHYVVEMDNEGRAHLRFGDGELGRMPEAGTAFIATYRVGNGPAGNVGAEMISHLVLRKRKLSGVKLRPCNPLPAQGGTAPESLAEVKLFAPHAFRAKLQRAITADDYAKLVMRDFKGKVQRAAAALRWTGSWYEVLVAIDPRDQVEADQDLLDKIKGHLHRYRRIGHDVVVKPARYVPLDIEMIVCVLPDYLRGHVKAALLDVLSNRTLPDGRRGFFHPDNLTFGEGIYLSQLVAAVQAIPGVESVEVKKLEHLDDGPSGEIEKGILPLGPLEIARLDNDASLPENGQLKLDMRGGR